MNTTFFVVTRILLVERKYGAAEKGNTQEKYLHTRYLKTVLQFIVLDNE